MTTLLDHARYPAEALVQLYHERWEIKTAYLTLRHTMLAGHVLRSGDRPGLEQEVWALLTVYQLLRMAIVEAIHSRPGTHPDRASVTTALETAHDQLTAAGGVIDASTDPIGDIGRAVLASLLPTRRPRYSARKLTCATSRYLNREDGRPSLPTTITAIDIAIHTPPIDRRPQTHQTASHQPRLDHQPAGNASPRSSAISHTAPGAEPNSPRC